MSSVEDFAITANRDYETCLLMESRFPEEFAISTASFHIQQAVERILKADILLMGSNPEHTHSIRKLSEECTKLGLHMPKGLDDIADSLTIWESSNRYDSYITFSKDKYDTAKNVYLELKCYFEMYMKAIKDLNEEDSELEEDKDYDGPQMTM